MVSLLSQVASAQFGNPMLEQTRMRLQDLSFCLGPAFEPLRELEVGLLKGYGGAGGGGGGGYAGRSGMEATPPPPAYLDSLDRDVEVCRAADKLGKDRKDDAKALLDGVRKDIEIKARDCQQFGMGRLVEVRVSTVRGAQKDDGWEVFYKWDCSSAFQPAELRAAKLTSPAVMEIPPGSYLVRAQKQQGSQVVKTDTTRVTVGLDRLAEIQIPVQ